MLKYLKIFFIFFCLMLAGCATYTEKIGRMQDYYTNADYVKAVSEVDNLIKSANKKDINLFLLERGKISFAQGNYDVSIKDFQEAETNLLNLEGTYSVSEEAGSILMDDTVRAFEASGFEQIMISPYLLISYLYKNKLDDALVEKNRTVNKITQYIERSGKDYLENAFSRCISAVLFLKENKLDDTRIEFNKIYKLTGLMEFKLDDENLKNASKKNQIYVFIENGLAPVKIEKKGTSVVDNKVINIVYPVYSKRGSKIKENEIFIDNKPVGKTKILFDLENVILKQFEKEEPKIIARMVARTVAKLAIQAKAEKTTKESSSDTAKTLGMVFDIATKVSAIAERADTRSWLSLPSRIEFFLIDDIEEGVHKIRVVSKGFDGTILADREKETVIKKTDKKIEYFIVSQ